MKQHDKLCCHIQGATRARIKDMESVKRRVEGWLPWAEKETCKKSRLFKIKKLPSIKVQFAESVL